MKNTVGSHLWWCSMKLLAVAAILLHLLAGSATALATMQASDRPARTVAITIDDLPRPGRDRSLAAVENVSRLLLDTLKREKVPAIGFVNEQYLFVDGEVDERIAVLRMWLDAGMELGNHTYAHSSLNQTPLWKFEDDVIRGETVTRRLLKQRNQALRFFRHPYTHTGRTREIRESFENFLSQRGYRVAPFTVENSDWIFDTAYRMALVSGDDDLAERVRAAYLDYTEAMFGYYEQRSRELLKREVAQIIVIHANEINAAVMDEFLARLRRRGYDFVSLEDALEDPAYQLEEGFFGAYGPSWLHRWALGMGRENRVRDEPDPPKFIMDIYEAR